MLNYKSISTVLIWTCPKPLILELGEGSGLTGLTASNFTGSSIDANTLAGQAASDYDDQDLILTGTVLSIEGGTTTVDLSVYAGSSLSDSEVEGIIADDVTTNFVPRDDGTKLVTGSIADNGSSIGIGIASPIGTVKLEVLGDVKATQFIGSFNGDLVGDGDVTSTTINGETTVTNKFILNSSLITDISNLGFIPVTSGVMRIRGVDGSIEANEAHVTTLGATIGAPQIALGSHDGELLIIRGMSDDGKVRIRDGDGLLLSAGVDFNLGENDTLTLIFDEVDGQWIEITRSDR